MKKDILKNLMSASMFAVFIFVVFSLMFAADAMAATSSSNTISLSLVNQDPDPAVAGDVFEVRIGIQNEGSSSYNDLQIEFIPEYPFTIVSGGDAVIDAGSISSYQGYGGDGDTIKTVKYRVMVDKDATAGTYELKFKSYEKGSSNSVQATFDIDIENKANVEVTGIDKTLLIPGRQTSMAFVITNVGSSPLRDLTFSWENSDKIILPVGGDNTKYISYIGVGESVNVTYEVVADSNADAGLYSMDLTLSYEDSLTGVSESINTIAGIYVGGGTDFDIAYSESSGSELSFTIANIGSNPAYSVSVIVPQQSGWTVSGANSVIIGNLNTGDYTVASFTLQRGIGLAASTGLNGEMPGAPSSNGTVPSRNSQSGSQGNALKIQVAYTDTMGNRAIVEKNVTLSQSVSSNNTSAIVMPGPSGSFNGMPGRMRQQSFFSKYKTYIFVLLAVIVVVFTIIYYKRYKREKILNPHFKFKDLFFRREQVQSPAKKK